jgi:hypothetical protein
VDLSDIKKNFLGPFYRSPTNPKWHWMKKCPDFPQEGNIFTVITLEFPDPLVLCQKCLELHMNEGPDENFNDITHHPSA